MCLSDDLQIRALFNEAESGTKTPLCYFWHLPLSGTFFATSTKIEHRKNLGMCPTGKRFREVFVWTRLVGF